MKEDKFNEYKAAFNEVVEKMDDKFEFPQSMEPILDVFSQLCKGEVCYSLHQIIDKKYTRFVLGGPKELERRRLTTEKARIEEGYIGATLQDKKSAYRIFNELKDEDGYIRAYEESKSEIVIKIPHFSVSARDIFGIINLESSEESAFDELDGLVFLMIAYWAAYNVYINESNAQANKERFGTLNALKQAEALDIESGRFFKRVFGFSKDVIGANAFSLIKFSPNIGAVKNIEPIYCDGYGENIYQTYEKKDHKFAKAVLDSNEVLSECVDGRGDTYKLSEYRKKTKYAVGAKFPEDEDAAVPPRGAAIFEFNQVVENEEPVKELTRWLSSLCGELLSLTSRLKECNGIKRVVNTLPLLDSAEKEEGLTSGYLTKIAKQLAESLQSDACIFYEVVKNEAQHICMAHYVKANRESNVYWNKKVDVLHEEITSSIEINGFYDKGHEFDSSEKSKLHCRIFASKLENNIKKDILFVSIKLVDEDSYKKLRMSTYSKKILNVQSTLISSTLEKNMYSYSSNVFHNGMRSMMRQLVDYKISSEETNCSEGRKETLFKIFHEIIADLRICDIKEPYASIFLYDKKEKILRMANASYEFLKSKCYDKSSFPPDRLAFDVAPSCKKEGLTRKVWNSAQHVKVFVSGNVSNSGAPECRDWWDKAIGIPAGGRYFAGTKIPGEQPAEYHGVLTVNGTKPIGLVGRFMETEWEVSSFLQVIAEELGYQLARIKDEKI